MTGYHLASKGVAHISHVKLALFLSNLGIETDMEQHITKFLTNVRDIILDKSIAELISLLDGIWSKTLVGLLFVPRTICP